MHNCAQLIGVSAMTGGAECNPVSGYGWIGDQAVIIADQARIVAGLLLESRAPPPTGLFL